MAGVRGRSLYTCEGPDPPALRVRHHASAARAADAPSAKNFVPRADDAEHRVGYSKSARAAPSRPSSTASHPRRRRVRFFFEIRNRLARRLAGGVPKKSAQKLLIVFFLCAILAIVSRSMLEVLKTTEKRIQLTGKFPVLESLAPVRTGGAFRFLTFYGGE